MVVANKTFESSQKGDFKHFWIVKANPAAEASGGAMKLFLKGLILAQNERWRRGLGMQVAGIPRKGGNRRKGQ